MTLGRTAESLRLARETVGLWLADGPQEVRDDAALIVSELVTNVLRHVPGGVHRDWVDVRLGRGRGFVRLEVVDPGTDLSGPELGEDDLLSESGRGLRLVAGLAVRCGTWRTGDGCRVVRADLAWPGAGTP
ncbi:ATP-binding protein [Actinomadura sp. ATCC 31491]|uniref:ATP-binding protein n=1 Tax=Actinomadura luzonensis TaxID=2805427 RepID=A0ABT0G5U0_9ACTN|nr:ATP-binding protein [Actinomadura luzonensis]MCK2219555.1 ATP-binding protein [Actinomadura luzonensis]